MTAEAVIGIISICATITLAIAAGTAWICAKIEKVTIALSGMVTKKDCDNLRKQCSKKRRATTPGIRTR